MKFVAGTVLLALALCAVWEKMDIYRTGYAIEQLQASEEAGAAGAENAEAGVRPVDRAGSDRTGGGVSAWHDAAPVQSGRVGAGRFTAIEERAGGTRSPGVAYPMREGRRLP